MKNRIKSKHQLLIGVVSVGISFTSGSLHAVNEFNIDVMPTYDDRMIEIWGEDPRPRKADAMDDFDTSGSAESRVRAAILKSLGAANKAFQNSGTSIQFSPVWMHKVDRTFNGDWLGFWDVVNTDNDIYETPRDQIGADIVIFYSDWTGADGSANYPGDAPEPDYQADVCMVRADNIWGTTTAHELGHCLNAGHPFGQQFYGESGGYYNTVMARRGGGRSGIWYFTNPDLVFDGVPLGTATENNTGRINLRKTTTVNYRSLKPADGPRDLLWTIVSRETNKAIARSASEQDQQVFQASDPTRKTQTQSTNVGNVSEYNAELEYHLGLKQSFQWYLRQYSNTPYFVIRSRRNWTRAEGEPWQNGTKFLRILENSQDNRNGAPIVLRDWTSDPRGHWSLEQTDGGFYEINNRYSGKSIHVPGNNPNDGQVLTQWQGAEIYENTHWYLRTY